MGTTWTFGKKIAAGFALAFMALVVIGGVAYRSINSLTQTSYAVTHTHLVLEHLAAVLSLMKDAETGQRGFVIAGEDSYLTPYKSAIPETARVQRELHELTSDNPVQQRRLTELEPLLTAKLSELARTIDMRRTQGLEVTTKFIQGGEGKKVMDDIRSVLADMERDERALLKKRSDEVEAASASANMTIALGTLLALALVVGFGYAITRSLTSQVGAAVAHVQSSSSELQTAANQQASAAKEQSTAMSEITTTINELLATSRQIAESAQRVAHIAEDTATSARAGEQQVAKTSDSLGSIKRQVDLIVTHMLDLGKKSQQIGGILEIINELAEQTNILAINATIEAAGAGDTGKRFAVVADEIRKLADRVGGSTKEIRTLIDEIRAAVNTTVMTTEGGTKAVDAGTRQFSEVAAALVQIVRSVVTTTEAAREIELSTKQQSTAVQQVNIAVSNVSQATKETETTATQTLQTASQLTGLSRELMRMIQPQASA